MASTAMAKSCVLFIVQIILYCNHGEIHVRKDYTYNTGII